LDVIRHNQNNVQSVKEFLNQELVLARDAPV
jgi:hypothetical protein